MPIYVQIPTLGGDIKANGYDHYFVADSFSFAIEAEMKECGAPAGARDAILSGETTALEPIYRAPEPADSEAGGTAEIDFVEVAGADGF